MVNTSGKFRGNRGMWTYNVIRKPNFSHINTVLAPQIILTVWQVNVYKAHDGVKPEKPTTSMQWVHEILKYRFCPNQINYSSHVDLWMLIVPCGHKGNTDLSHSYIYMYRNM